jgi:hypothetical protein
VFPSLLAGEIVNGRVRWSCNLTSLWPAWANQQRISKGLPLANTGQPFANAIRCIGNDLEPVFVLAALDAKLSYDIRLLTRRIMSPTLESPSYRLPYQPLLFL